MVPLGVAIVDGTPRAAQASVVADIPGDYLVLYRGAVTTCPGLSWTVLAAIGKIETNHGRSTSPGVSSGTNSAGAAGPMQFLAATFAAYRIDGGGDGDGDIYDPADAIYSAANYLCANGTGNPDTLRGAVFAYNHANWYVEDVLAQAAVYAAAATTPGGPMASPGHPVPEAETVEVITAGGATTRVWAPTAQLWQALFDAAAADGLALSGGGWRSAAQQWALRHARCPSREYDPGCVGRPPTAIPGVSRHEWGVAVDFTCAGALVRHGDRCWDWLVANAGGFGIRNLASESWHWSGDAR